MVEKRKVLVVDDVAMVRESIRDIIESIQGFEVIGEAGDGATALRMIPSLRPDLITLDIVMPGMSGLTALKHLMIHSPTPTVMISSLTQEGAEQAFDSIRFGAVDFVPKLSKLEISDLERQKAEVATKLRWAAQVDVQALRYLPLPPLARAGAEGEGEVERLVALGAAQGGYASLLKILPRLPASSPLTFIAVLYEHARYVDSFIDYLNRYCQIQVERAVDGAPLRPGVCYISAGEDYVTLRHVGDGIGLHVHPAPFESQRGSFNRVLYSATDMLGHQVVGVVLSGSGDDGAEGLAEVSRVGGVAIIQDPASCLVREMAETALAYSGEGGVICDAHVADQLNRLFVEK